MAPSVSIVYMIYDMIYLSTAIELTPGGSGTVHTNNTYNNTSNNRTTQITVQHNNNRRA